MKKLVSAILILFLLISLNACAEPDGSERYLRIHIRANSNSYADQDVKYAVKEGVVNFLAPKLAECTTKEQARKTVLDYKAEIEKIAAEILEKNGFGYGAAAEIRKENFPTRSYSDVTLESGVYEALIINLGDGRGDNWWCVVYPPLCFVGGEFTDGQTLKYKSKLLEIIQEFFD